MQIVSVFFGHFLWHFLTAEIGNFVQFENSVAPHPAESKRQAITYISYLFAFFDLQVRRPAKLAWTLPFSLFEVLVEIKRNKWTLDYFKSISEKLRGIIFSFMHGNTSLLKRVCKEKSFQNNLFLDMISYRINILNEKRDVVVSSLNKCKTDIYLFHDLPCRLSIFFFIIMQKQWFEFQVCDTSNIS